MLARVADLVADNEDATEKEQEQIQNRMKSFAAVRKGALAMKESNGAAGEWIIVQRGRVLSSNPAPQHKDTTTVSSFVRADTLPKIIVLQGANGCGKSTAAAYLCDFYCYVRESFAFPLKQIAHVCFGFPEVCLYGTDAEKNLVNVHVNESSRKVLQILGTEGFRHNLRKLLPTLKMDEGLTFWAWRMRRIIQKHVSEGRNVVIDDCRFPDEISMLHDLQRADGTTCSIWQIFRDNGGNGLPMNNIFTLERQHELAHQVPVLSEDVIEDAHVSEICVRILFPFHERYMQMENRHRVDPALGISFAMAEKAFLIIINDVLLREHLPHMLHGLTMREWRRRVIDGVSTMKDSSFVPAEMMDMGSGSGVVAQSQAPKSHASNNPTALYHDIEILNDSDKEYLFSRIDAILQLNN